MISILLPFRNAESTIRACLASIRQQDMRHYEILAVDDHSGDRTRQRVLAWPDTRIRLIDNPGEGLVDALNFGLSQARFPLIARMDADDLMRSNRLRVQHELLTSRPDIDLVSGRVALFPATSIGKGYREYARWQNGLLVHDDISAERFVESPIAHPSVMFRRDTVVKLGGYCKGDFPEDYELWLRAIDQGIKFAKSPSTLIDWRESKNRLSRTHTVYRRQAFDQLRAKYLARLPVLKQRPVVFWGAGRKTRLRASHIVNMGVHPKAWIDIDPRKIGNLIRGVPVHAPAFLRVSNDTQKPFVLIYVTNHGARELIQSDLTQIGYRINRDFLAVG